MVVSVIIPVKDDPRLFACVESVLACCSDTFALEMIVVDDGSDAAFKASLKALPSEVILVEIPHAGAYAARNRGVERASGEFVLFTDADCTVRPGWAEAAVEELKRGAAVVQGYSGSISNAPLARLIQARYEAHLRRVRPGQATECDTRNLAVRREVLGRVTFNEQFRRAGDTEFGLLAEAAGFSVSYWPSMRVDHQHE